MSHIKYEIVTASAHPGAGHRADHVPKAIAQKGDKVKIGANNPSERVTRVEPLPKPEPSTLFPGVFLTEKVTTEKDHTYKRPTPPNN